MTGLSTVLIIMRVDLALRMLGELERDWLLNIKSNAGQALHARFSTLALFGTCSKLQYTF